MKPRLLDLFCGAGGAAMGYHRAGFEVVGVDIKPQPRYPFEFHQGDAVDVLESIRDGGQWYYEIGDPDAIHASPPCQRWTRSRSAEEWPDFIAPIRDAIHSLGDVPYVIENVPRAPLLQPTILCGSSFGLRVRRHRAFETDFLVWGAPTCMHTNDFITVAGGGPNPASFRRGPNATGGPDRKPKNIADALDAMGINWQMTRKEVNEAIPPAYTELIGHQLMSHLKARTAA
jgi:DNA (cytosine-5)-methyltransferase 1